MKDRDLKLEKRLNDLDTRLNALRTTHRGRKFPQPIWDEVVELAKLLGVSPVCRKLGLSHSRLKRLVQKNVPQKQRPQSLVKRPSFLEIPLATPSSGRLMEKPYFQFQLKWGSKMFKLEWGLC